MHMFCANPLYGRELHYKFYLFGETKKKLARLPMRSKLTLSQLTQGVGILLNNYGMGIKVFLRFSMNALSRF